MNEMDVPLLLNGRLLGELWIRVDMSGNAEVDAVRLSALLHDVLSASAWAAIVQRIAGRSRIKVTDLAGLPVKVDFDPGSLQLEAQASNDQIRIFRIDAAGITPPQLQSFAPQSGLAGGVGVAVEQEWSETGPDRGRLPLRLTLDGFLTAGSFPGVTLRGGGDLVERVGRSGFDFTRSPIRLSTDLFASALHLAAGELTPGAASFQGTAPILGIGIGRDYSGIRPFDNIRPSARGVIVLDRRSTVVVEVNGLETRKLFLDPGRYEVSSITGTFGANQARLYVEDDLGRREVASASFFTSSTLLAAGLTDFGAWAGKLGSANGKYAGPFVASGYARHGIASKFTIGGGAQVGGGSWQASGEFIWGSPIGAFRLEGALSRAKGLGGKAASIDWLQTATLGRGKLNFSLAASAMTRHFGSPFDGASRDNDSRWRVDARADWQQGEWGLIAAGSFGQTRSGSGEQGISLTTYWSNDRLSVTGSAGLEKTGPGGWGARVMIGLSVKFDSRDSLSLRGDSRKSHPSIEFARYPRDELDDISGRIRLERDDTRWGATGSLRYFGNRFLLSADQDWYSSTDPNLADERRTRLRIATFLGFADGAVGLGRPPAYGFVVVDPHSSLAGSAVTIKDDAGFAVGKRDILGAPLVPFNRSFSPVQLDAEVTPLPEGYDIGDPRLNAFPGNRSGYRMRIGSDAWHVVTGYLIATDGPLGAISGTVEKVGQAAAKPRPFYTNAAGRFAADGLSAGEYRMVVDGREIARFKINQLDKGMTDVGKIKVEQP